MGRELECTTAGWATKNLIQVFALIMVEQDRIHACQVRTQITSTAARSEPESTT